MRYQVYVDIDPGERPRWQAYVGDEQQLGGGTGYDLTDALIRAGTAIVEDARQRPGLWSVVK